MGQPNTIYEDKQINKGELTAILNPFADQHALDHLPLTVKIPDHSSLNDTIQL